MVNTVGACDGAAVIAETCVVLTVKPRRCHLGKPLPAFPANALAPDANPVAARLAPWKTPGLAEAAVLLR
jgi:hypothetical protein